MDFIKVLNKKSPQIMWEKTMMGMFLITVLLLIIPPFGTKIATNVILLTMFYQMLKIIFMIKFLLVILEFHIKIEIKIIKNYPNFLKFIWVLTLCAKGHSTNHLQEFIMKIVGAQMDIMILFIQKNV